MNEEIRIVQLDANGYEVGPLYTTDKYSRDAEYYARTVLKDVRREHPNNIYALYINGQKQPD
ncbi:MAG: hypothetical protein CMF62_06215 [Magnetococcales bacterium]|nr:hypothetical protein [Magnetococcales bacterium]|tara:strand:+ start:281650 stop:281835 length:186 start_codon:yes stop_codon:yes gene_type:complete